jgi:CMP-N,N'-diacetyllegionaminic acid synthase
MKIIDKNEIIALVCARGNSKGIKNKNLLKINNKPLIYFAINKILKNKINYNCISTDNKKIFKLSKNFGLNGFFLRPKALSGSNVSKLDVWKHALNISEKFYEKKFKYLLDVEVTNPLTSSKDLNNFILKFFQIKNVFDGMFCARRSWKNPYFNILEKNGKNFSVSKKLKNRIVARQKAPATYDHIAAMYIFKSSYVRKAKNFLDGKLKHYNLPLNKSIDIDSIEEYELVKKLIDKNV